MQKQRSSRTLIALTALLVTVGGEQVHAQSTTVTVPANVEWVDTGVDVRAGVVFTLSISATGNWTNATGGQSVGAAGYGSLKLPNSIAPSEPFASLIGRVNGTVFGIGENFRKRSPASGRLFLAMNDIPGTFGDNSGELTVVITRSTNGAVTGFQDPVIFLDLVTADPQPFFAQPSFRWTARNKIRPTFSAELKVLLDGAPASTQPGLPIVADLAPGTERSDQFALFTGVDPVLPAGQHTIVIELRALTPNHELLASATTSVTSFVPSPPPSISIVDFKATPDYQDQGKEITLSWKLQPTSFCVPADLLLKKKDFGVPEVIILQVATPSTPGERNETVKGTSSPLKYILSVACKFTVGGVTQAGTGTTSEVKVSFPPAPPPPIPNVVHFGPFFTPMQVREKQAFSVSWSFLNAGGAKSDEFDVQLYLDGAKEGDKQSVPAYESGKTSNLTWSISKELLAGIHNIELKRVADGGSLDYTQFQAAP